MGTVIKLIRDRTKLGLLSSFSSSATPFSFGKALSFDGVDDYFTLNTALNTIAFTVSIWFKLPSNYSNSRVISGVSLTQWLEIRTGGIIHIRNDAQGITFNNATLLANTWYHLYIGRNSSGNARVFLNGTESSSGTQNVGGTCEYLYLGTQGTFQFYNVIVDDVLLTSSYGNPDTEATALYNGGNGVDPLTIIPTAQQLYRLNENGNNDGSLGGSGTLNNFIADPYVNH